MVKTPQCDVQVVLQLVMRIVPEARPESHISDELSVHLPTEASSNFEVLFNEIESRKSELGIASFGASMTSMEEVFLKWANGRNGNERSFKKTSINSRITFGENLART